MEQQALAHVPKPLILGGNKMKRMHKIAAVLLALVMVLMALPVAMAAEQTHVLDVSTDLEALSPSADNAGKEIVVGDYFTVILGEKTKIDGSKKNFADEYAATQRLNFQHKTKANEAGVILPAVKFTTSGAATVKLWWVEGGDDNRQMVILNEAGEEVVRTNETLAKNDLCISELKLEAAGTYYLGTPDGSNYLFKMEVTESVADAPIAPTEPEGGEDVDKTGDLTFVAMAVMLVSAAALVILVQKKRAF